ncbi:MAG: hypothetical protein KJO56_07690 [Gammaproteobacteria bacterium]|nr:hypothetical protein [Gammaproteobacteria bacterium]MBT8105405.1 hypothetical protein [Gammaproteobacteria bacterium]NNF49268.1 hypothetical protein [Woeseiaceae bacterium]NNK25419.1 hypothetical protein [Woeseiaceae bacterium]
MEGRAPRLGTLLVRGPEDYSVVLSCDITRRSGLARRFAAFFFALLVCGAGACASAPESVLFVGNSFSFYNNGVHNHYRQLAASTGSEVETRMTAISGGRLHEHVPATTSLAAAEDWNVIVFQAHSLETFGDDQAAAFHNGMKRLAEIARDNDATPTLFMTWAYRSQPDMTPTLEREYRRAAAANDAVLVPVGSAFARAVAQRPELALRMDDDKHPTLAGTYLAACIFYAVLHDESPAGLEYIAGLEPDDALFLQRVAAEVAGHAD